MFWLIIAIIAYLFNAFVLLVDKFLLQKAVVKPAVFAFFVGFLGLAGLILAPWGFNFENPLGIFVALVTGLIYIMALPIFYLAMRRGDASQIGPLVGGFTPLFIFMLAWTFLGEHLNYWQAVAFFVIIAGSFLISLEIKKGKIITSKAFLLAIAAAILFGISHTLSKFVYSKLDMGFINGFIWIRIGGFLAALLLLAWPQVREEIKPKITRNKSAKWWLIFMGQASGAIGFMLFNYAFYLGPLSLVNALQGVQYVFLFLIILLFSYKFPTILKEKLTPRVIIQKTVSIILISFGLAMLAILG